MDADRGLSMHPVGSRHADVQLTLQGRWDPVEGPRVLACVDGLPAAGSDATLQLLRTLGQHGSW